MAEIPEKPKPTRTTGLSPKEQKLQALRGKLAQKTNSAGKSQASATGLNFKAKNTFAGKKTAFQRKAT